jgi:hypothetical protein
MGRVRIKPNTHNTYISRTAAKSKSADEEKPFCRVDADLAKSSGTACITNIVLSVVIIYAID